MELKENNKFLDKMEHKDKTDKEVYRPEQETEKQMELEKLEGMAKALDKLCMDNLFSMQQIFEKEMKLVHKILYIELSDVMNHTTAIMNLCAGYSNLVGDLLKARNGQIDTELVYSHFTKIEEIFSGIASSFKEDETG